MSPARRWLVLGSRGLLGTEVMSALAEHTVVGVGRAELDITDASAVAEFVYGFDVVVNCAAWTAVDEAESHEAEAFAVNAVGAGNVAEACALNRARLVHLSTDYVFAGDATTPYPENATLDPRGAYGRTKAEGERRVRAALPDALVLRTAWLYGAHGPNFVRTIIRLAKERDTLSVVDDQRGQPTWAGDVAARIVEVIEAEAPGGTYHATNSGDVTWCGFARRIVELLGDDPARVLPVTTADFPRPAARPAYSVLAHDGWSQAGLAPMRPWSQALDAAWPSITATS